MGNKTCQKYLFIQPYRRKGSESGDPTCDATAPTNDDVETYNKRKLVLDQCSVLQEVESLTSNSDNIKSVNENKLIGKGTIVFGLISSSDLDKSISFARPIKSKKGNIITIKMSSKNWGKI